MKRITTILSLIAMMLVSGVSFADDINLFLNNHADNALRTSADQALAKPQMLFLIDIIGGGEICDNWSCTNMSGDAIQCPIQNEQDGVDGSTTCTYGTSGSSGSWQFSEYLASPADFGYLSDFMFAGKICTFNPGGEVEGVPAYKKVAQCTSGGAADYRPIIAEIMRQRPDAKFGVISLETGDDDPDTTDVEPTIRSGKLVLEVLARDSAQIEAAITTLNNNATVIERGSIPTAGGLAKAYDYLSGNSSPMNEKCENLHLVMMTNGGWKDDAVPSATSLNSITGITASTATTSANLLKQIAEQFRNTAATGCDAKIMTSVIGLGVATDNVNAPPFKISGSSSPAMVIAKAGGGKYLNTGNGKAIVNEVLGLLDYSHPDPSALISPSSPVSASRSHNLSLLFASAFKPEGKIAWPGNMSMGTVAEWTAAGGNSMDPTQFDNSSSVINGLSGITIKTDLCAPGATALCALSDVNSDILTADDVTWLAGSGLDNNDVFGDPIHFKTLAIHYGDVNGDGDKADHDDDPETDDVYMAIPGTRELYVLVGTNRGLLHMFEYITGGTLVHKWAFFPKELERLVPALRNGNLASSYNMVNHFYGIDGAPSVFIYDAGKDGKIKPDADAANANDRVLLYFGLRRGGATYYALDITAPATPKLLWSKGKSIADYGTKPAADPIITDGTPYPKTIPVPEMPGGGGDCPVFSSNNADGLISTVPFANSTPGYPALNCCNKGETLYDAAGNEVSVESAEGQALMAEIQSHQEKIGDFDGTIYQHTAVYLKDVINGKMPIFTQKNQCVKTFAADDPNDSQPHTFDAHPLAVSPMARGSGDATCAGRSTNVTNAASGIGLKGASSVGIWLSNVELRTIVGFDLTSVPDDAYITSARLTMGHTGSGTVVDAQAQYGNGIAIFASKKGYYGSEPALENDGSPCTDWYDANETNKYGNATSTNYTYIGALKMPQSGTVNLGDRTGGGDLFPQSLFPDFYYEDGTINDTGIHALTRLISKWKDGTSFSSSLNDNFHDIKWQQFLLKSIAPSANEMVWGAPKAGKIPSNWAYNNHESANPGVTSYWDAVAPKLVLTWTRTAPQTPAPSTLESSMSVSISKFKPELTVEVSGNGKIVGMKQGGSSNIIDCGSTCAVELTNGTAVTLSAETKDGSTFTGWSNCQENGGVVSVSGITCTIAVKDSYTVTAIFEGGTACYTAGNYDHVNAGRADPYEKYAGAGSTYAQAVGSGQDIGLIGSEWQSTVTSLKETSTDYWVEVGSCE